MTTLPPLDTHGIYPWSVLRSDSAPWQARKRWWLHDMGVDDLAGRQGVEIFRHGRSGRHHRISGGKSRFDPVLAELMLTWYSPRGGLVIDPFAGGVTRGAVASHLGRRYHGIDLSPTQVDANQSEAHRWPGATWETGDARDGLGVAPGTADYILTCPPYHSAERYSDDPRDLSVMTWDQHLAALAEIAGHAYEALADDRFLTWVVGDLRDHRGHLRCLPEHTLTILTGAGLHPVNHHILVTPVGTMHRMLRRWWTSTRTAGRVHQHVYTLVKGDRRRAVEAIRAAD